VWFWKEFSGQLNLWHLINTVISSISLEVLPCKIFNITNRCTHVYSPTLHQSYPCADHEGMTGGVTPHILHFNTRCRSVVGFTPWPICLQRITMVTLCYLVYLMEHAILKDQTTHVWERLIRPVLHNLTPVTVIIKIPSKPSRFVTYHQVQR
jgi:hypothetical protein